MTALLAVMAEPLVDDHRRRLRCRASWLNADERLPRWITALPRVEATTARMRRTHVFGDVDEVVIGMRFDGGHELIRRDPAIDHDLWSTSPMQSQYQNRSTRAACAGGRTSCDPDVSEMTWPMRGCG